MTRMAVSWRVLPSGHLGEEALWLPPGSSDLQWLFSISPCRGWAVPNSRDASAKSYRATGWRSWPSRGSVGVSDCIRGQLRSPHPEAGDGRAGSSAAQFIGVVRPP